MKETLPPEEFKKWEVSYFPTTNPDDTPTTGTGGWTIGAFSDDPEEGRDVHGVHQGIYMGRATK